MFRSVDELQVLMRNNYISDSILIENVASKNYFMVVDDSRVAALTNNNYMTMSHNRTGMIQQMLRVEFLYTTQAATCTCKFIIMYNTLYTLPRFVFIEHPLG